jgi:uncharacterized membrane protein YhaH (DUF805 family)
LRNFNRSLFDIAPTLWSADIATVIKRLLVNNADLAVTRLRNTNRSGLCALIANVALRDLSSNNLRAHTV